MAGSTEPREKAVPKYFRKTPEMPAKPDLHGPRAAMAIGTIVAVLGCLLAALTSSSFDAEALACLGWFGAFGGLVPLFWGLVKTSAKTTEYQSRMKTYKEEYEKAEPKPTDQQMDQWLAGDIARLKKEALHKLDLVPEQLLRDPDDPILVIGPAPNAEVRVGDDLKLRFSKYNMVFIYLTDYHLAAYNCTLDMTDGVVTRESTQEYHYADVVSVSTRTESSETFTLYVNGEAKNIPLRQEFALSVASGEQIRVVTAFPKLAEYIEKGELPPTGADEAIAIIRSRLREKKGGTHA